MYHTSSNWEKGRRILSLAFIFVSLLSLIGLVVMLNGVTKTAALSSETNQSYLTAAETAVPTPYPQPTRITPSFADVYISPRADEGAVASAYQAVYGPYLCPNYGDPFSTLNSPWEPGIYTYTYRIMIPPDYVTNHDTLRIELLDPDSWAAPGYLADVTHTATAVGLGKPPIEYGMSANDSSQSRNSLVYTGETDLIGANLNGITVTEEMINPWWFLRMDVHYGSGLPPGNGNCGVIMPYNVDYNSETRYQLYYYRDNGDGTVERVELSTYTGQTGREAAEDNHDTNLRWVSPALSGVDQKSYDQTVDVPVDAGSATGFHLNITDNPDTDIPDIATDPDTGARYIYMGISAISGSTQNGYELWAGPPEYTATVPSDLNFRNVHLADNPGSHTADGAIVYAVGRLPMKAAATDPATVPLMYVGSEYAGQTIYVNQYDSDTGASPPMIFYFDTLDFMHDLACDPSVSGNSTINHDGYCDGVDWSQTAWALSFGNYQDNVDPDGHSGRCRSGTCTTRWVNPAYEIEVPGDLVNCNKRALPPDGNINTDPDGKTCEPFSGGRLMARYRTGKDDVYGWQVSLTAGDTVRPRIGEPVYPLYAPVSQTITVTANISDVLSGGNGILAATLYYGYTAPYTQTVTGIKPVGNGDGIWAFGIPTQSAAYEGQTLSFWLEAMDADTTSETAVSDNNGAYYPINIIDDATGIIFTDLSYPAAITSTEPFTITVNISDVMSGHSVLSATLHAGYFEPYNYLEFVGTGPGGDGNGVWTFNIPAQGISNKGHVLNFWLSAEDGGGAGETAVDDNDGAYYSIHIINDLFTNIYAPRPEDGSIFSTYQAVVGPYLCPEFGDPFSTLNSPWEPGIYTYQYRIAIPPDYIAYNDTLRIEILDPDSWAAPGDTAEIVHSNTAIALGMDYISYTVLANDSRRSHSSAVYTGEYDLIGEKLNGRTVTEKDVNPWWLLRMDVNAGDGLPPGNGNCGLITPYDTAYNSETLYQLYYYRENETGGIERVDLSSYTGQTGREAPEDDHDTNLRWVSPALPNDDQRSFDQVINVPVDAGSDKGFHLNISDNPNTDVPNIATDQNTGMRYIYMNVTAVSGSTVNGYELWAGPDYRSTVPSMVNSRNIYLISNPGSHIFRRVIVHSMGKVPIGSVTTQTVTIPIMYIGPEYGGQTVHVSQYDSDAGATPPLIFYLDTIPFTHDPECSPLSDGVDTITNHDGYCDGVDWTQTEWAMSFGNYADNVDPDGESGRCRPGTCATQWVNSVYEIKIPGDLENCNKRALPPDGNINADPDSKTCVPFYGGHLMARYRAEKSDIHTWNIYADMDHPILTNLTYVTTTHSSQVVTVTVNISDSMGNNGVAVTGLYYGYTPSYNQQYINGTRVGGDASTLWSFVIPAQGEAHEGEVISFSLRVSAVEGSGIDNNGGAYYQIYVDDDTTAPVFTDLSYPATITSTDSFTITVNISDTVGGHGVLTSTLHYGYADPYDQIEVVGTEPGGNGDGVWTFSIPAQGAAHEGEAFTFWLSAVDGDDTPMMSVDDNAGTYYPITITDDDIAAPIFSELSYPATITSTDSFTITVNISDTVGGHGVLTSTLHYGYVDPYDQYKIIGTGSSGNGDGVWMFNIPAQGVAHEDEVFIFWLSATDGDNTPMMSVDDNNGAYYSVNITSRIYHIHLPIITR